MFEIQIISKFAVTLLFVSSPWANLFPRLRVVKFVVSRIFALIPEQTGNWNIVGVRGIGFDTDDKYKGIIISHCFPFPTRPVRGRYVENTFHKEYQSSLAPSAKCAA